MGVGGCMHEPVVILIGKPVGPVALDVAAAFWQARLSARVLYVFLSCATVALLGLTAAGGLGRYSI